MLQLILLFWCCILCDFLELYCASLGWLQICDCSFFYYLLYCWPLKQTNPKNILPNSNHFSCWFSFTRSSIFDAWLCVSGTPEQILLKGCGCLCATAIAIAFDIGQLLSSGWSARSYLHWKGFFGLCKWVAWLLREIGRVKRIGKGWKLGGHWAE